MHKVITGVAVRFDEITVDNRMFVSGCFDRDIPRHASLRLYSVPLLLWHDESLQVADSVEVEQDRHCLRFRCVIERPSALAQLALELCEKGEAAACSVGYKQLSGRKVILPGGRQVEYVEDAHLCEISIVKAGAVRTTHARVGRVERIAA